jgi:hypothetical protein
MQKSIHRTEGWHPFLLSPKGTVLFKKNGSLAPARNPPRIAPTAAPVKNHLSPASRGTPPLREEKFVLKLNF